MADKARVHQVSQYLEDKGQVIGPEGLKDSSALGLADLAAMLASPDPVRLTESKALLEGTIIPETKCNLETLFSAIKKMDFIPSCQPHWPYLERCDSPAPCPSCTGCLQCFPSPSQPCESCEDMNYPQYDNETLLYSLSSASLACHGLIRTCGKVLEPCTKSSLCPACSFCLECLPTLDYPCTP